METGASRVRVLGGNRAGEMRITRFLRNPSVTMAEMVGSAASRTCLRAEGIDILAIQDTTDLRSQNGAASLALHPTLAVEADSGAILGLAGAEFLHREGGTKARRKVTAFADKESARWLRGMEASTGLRDAGAARVTAVMDREGDIFEDFALRPEGDFALRPEGIDILIRAAQDRLLASGDKLFATADALPEIGRIETDLPASPGRKARRATFALRSAVIEIARPDRASTAERDALPETVSLTLVDAREIGPATPGKPLAHWRLLTSHTVRTLVDAERIVGFYRRRWTIEQVFRTLKTRGFDIEALRIRDDEPFEKLAMAALIAAITIMQLVHERDGAAKRPLRDAFDAGDDAFLRHLCASLEGKTEKQKNPHPPNSLAFAAWVFARLGGWNCYYGKPGPIVMFNGLIRYQNLRQGWILRDV